MYELIDFMNTSLFMYLMVVWAIMLPVFFYTLHRHEEIAAMNGFIGETIKVIYLTISFYEVSGITLILLAITSALR